MPTPPTRRRRTSTWTPVDLADVLDQPDDTRPAVLTRDDDQAVLYPGRIHSVHGEPESLKSWFALHATAQQLRAGRSVAYLDFEDEPRTVAWRLTALGATRGDIVERLVYIRPAEPWGPAAVHSVDQLAARHPTLAVLDGVTEALALTQGDANNAADVARFLALLPRPLATGGAAVVLIDHVTKDAQTRGRWAAGSAHKLAGVDVAFTISLIAPFGRGRHGVARLVVVKDRPGHLRGLGDAREPVGELHLHGRADGTVDAYLAAPRTRTEPFRPTVLMARVSAELVRAPDGLSGRSLERLVRGKATGVRVAIERLAAEGFIDTNGSARTRVYRSVRPFTDDLEDDDEDDDGFLDDL